MVGRGTFRHVILAKRSRYELGKQLKIILELLICWLLGGHDVLYIHSEILAVC